MLNTDLHKFSLLFWALVVSTTSLSHAQYVDGFGPASLSNSSWPGTFSYVHNGKDNKFYVSSIFNLTQDNYWGPYRLLENGAIDPTFTINGEAQCGSGLLELNSGKILVSKFQPYATWPKSYTLSRLLPNGNHDPTFDAEHLGTFPPEFLFEMPDESILVLGSNIPRKIAKLKPNGSLDYTFDAGSGFSSSPNHLTLMDDGRILVVGSYINYNNQNLRSIVMLNPDGTIDSSFNPPFWSITPNIKIARIHQNGMIYMCGDFMPTSSSSPKRHMYRFFSNGTRDVAFDPNFDNTVEDFIFLPNGSLIAVGRFLSVNGKSRDRLAILDENGTLLESNPLRPGADSLINDIICIRPNKFVISGSFFVVNGLPQKRLSAFVIEDSNKLLNSPITFHPMKSDQSMIMMDCYLNRSQPTEIEVSNNLNNWSPFYTSLDGTGGIRTFTFSLADGNRFFRIKQ